MRTIIKHPEPKSLLEHRKSTHADYDNYDDKDTLRRSLVSEQHGLCCYCLSRITADRQAMKIAHWHPRAPNRYPKEQLDYSNLLGACKGNEGQPYRLQHCDTRQGDLEVSRNPANPAHRVEGLSRYKGNGRVGSDNRAFDHDLDEVLNLNVAFLVNRRKGVLDAFKVALSKRGPWSLDPQRRQMQKWGGGPGDRELKEFCQVVVYYLKKKIERVGGLR